MKAEIGELQRSFGEINLFPENSDDLWHLSHLITPGSLVFATTLRSVEGAQDKIRPEKQEKRPVRLGIRVQECEFHEYAVRLRVFGIIEHGVDIGSHHTLNLEPGYEVNVVRSWSQSDLDRIDRAVKGVSSDSVQILAIEEGEAELYRVHSFGPKLIYTHSSGSGKEATGMGTSRNDFYDGIISTVSTLEGPLVIAGPGFIKEDFASRLRSVLSDRKSPVLIIETRRSGRGAVQEVIGQGILEKLIGDLQLSREVRHMEELMTRIAKSQPVAYGFDEVLFAVQSGAVETLLVSDSLLREERFVALINEAEQMRSSVVVLSTKFEPGERLLALGGTAALLRYALS